MHDGTLFGHRVRGGRFDSPGRWRFVRRQAASARASETAALRSNSVVAPATPSSIASCSSAVSSPRSAATLSSERKRPPSGQAGGRVSYQRMATETRRAYHAQGDRLGSLGTLPIPPHTSHSGTRRPSFGFSGGYPRHFGHGLECLLSLNLLPLNPMPSA
jgi:hypothetical protein